MSVVSYKLFELNKKITITYGSLVTIMLYRDFIRILNLYECELIRERYIKGANVDLLMELSHVKIPIGGHIQ